MSLTPIFQRDLFGMDAGLSGWPTDGLDEPPLPAPASAAADLRASPAVHALRVALGLAAPHRHQDLRLAADGAVPQE